MVKFKQINNEVVRPFKGVEDMDKRPPRGEALIPSAFSNIYCCSKKKSGKTSTIAKMLQAFAGPETKVFVFCSTVFIDPTYIALEKYFHRKKIDYYPSTSIKDDEGHDLLADILKEEEDVSDGEEDEEKPNIQLLDLDEKKPAERKKKPSKFKELKYIFVFDDLSNEIRTSASLKKLLKTNRHLLSKVIISSQWVNDLEPQCINQLDYVFLFKSHNDDKLLEIWKKLDLCIEFELFKEIYQACTGDLTKFHFLYIDRFEQYRMDFNKLIILSDL